MPRYLGQHFLINKKKLRKIADAIEIEQGDVLIEIGSGHGELTSELVNRLIDKKIEAKIFAVEKDKNFVDFLKEKFSKEENIEIIEGDALKVLPKLTANYKLPIANYKLVGNIPYYITGYLLRILSELENKPSLIVFLIQKEVADRICALRQAQGKPLRQAQGKPKMNLLAASIQVWAEPEIIANVSKKYFRPPPKVDSSIIKLKPKTQNLTPETYYQFIKILYKQPRKTIINNLASGIKAQGLAETKEEIIKKLLETGINPNKRPQDLNIKQIIELSTLF
ncbi:MAG: 16S rRNA (adenine(1518)-N(6)/adenine(1519)-N(6))-dimethyltransferase RsmA [Patescibacteria group bacterium]